MHYRFQIFFGIGVSAFFCSDNAVYEVQDRCVARSSPLLSLAYRPLDVTEIIRTWSAFGNIGPIHRKGGDHLVESSQHALQGEIRVRHSPIDRRGNRSASTFISLARFTCMMRSLQAWRVSL